MNKKCLWKKKKKKKISSEKSLDEFSKNAKGGLRANETKFDPGNLSGQLANHHYVVKEIAVDPY